MVFRLIKAGQIDEASCFGGGFGAVANIERAHFVVASAMPKARATSLFDSPHEER